MTTNIETAASILGIGRTLAYELLATDDFPVPILRAHRRIIVPVAGLLAALGAPPAGRTPAGSATLTDAAND